MQYRIVHARVETVTCTATLFGLKTVRPMLDVFYQGWTGILRVVAVTVIAYAGLIFFLRITGKRMKAPEGRT